jgi:hypothetical protein
MGCRIRACQQEAKGAKQQSEIDRLSLFMCHISQSVVGMLRIFAEYLYQIDAFLILSDRRIF